MLFKKKFKLYHFELYHFIVILFIIILSQILIPIINKQSADKFLVRTIDFYRWDVAERIADQTTNSLELLFLRLHELPKPLEALKQATIEAIDMIIFQQKLQRSVDDFYIILGKGKNVNSYDDGIGLYKAIVDKKTNIVIQTQDRRAEVIAWYKSITGKIYDDEAIQYTQKGNTIFHFLIPFSLRGEIIGALYMKISPDLEVVESSIASSFQQSGLLFSIFILIGLLGLFLMTTLLLRERDQAQELLYQKREKQLTKEIENRKEAVFVRRIYHAHHKVEKIIGFAKEDLLKWPENIYPEIKVRLNKYMNFIGRVVYSMKTVNPPVQVIRNQRFKTDVNSLIKFIIDNIFRRVYKESDQYIFNLELDYNCPVIHINKYVAWEIFEPLINNSIDHNKTKKTTITIRSKYDSSKEQILIEILDNGNGINPGFLKVNRFGVQNIFIENITSKDYSDNSGYGCYIAYENCRRCGWTVNANNNKKGGAIFIIHIPVI